MILHGREVEVHVDNIEPFENDMWVGFRILWSGNIGFGEYTIYREPNTNKWYVDDEYMEDPHGNTSFLQILLNDFMKQLEEQ